MTGATYICGGDYIARTSVGQCPGACRIGDSQIVSTEGSPWYEPTQHCTNCGDIWCSEGLGDRPFRRGWRQEAITKHVALWESGCTCPIERDADMYPILCKHAREEAAA